ncbi:MAG: TRAP transporter substrate-binding protein DctP, partial [Gemmatimonadota bacterium]
AVPYPSQMVFCNAEIDDLEDLEGKKIRASGRSTANFLDAIGAAGTTLDFSEVPGALDRGVIDCAVTGSLSGYSSGWHEVSTHLYPLPVGGWDYVITAMNRDKWESLTPELQDWLIAEVEDAVRRRVPTPPEGLSWEVRMATELQRTYTGVEADRNLLTPGFLMEPDDPMIVAAAEAVGRREGDGPATIRPWQFATDGGWSCGLLGIPTVGFAPGEESHAHTNRERLSLEDARWALERYPEIIVAVQEALKEGG